MKGSCLCHAVTLTIHNPAPVLDLGLEVCHCTDCRQHSGATGAFLTVKNDNFAIEGAEHLKKYTGTSDAGNELVWFWCDGCGGKVYQTSEGFEGEASVSAGEPLRTNHRG